MSGGANTIAAAWFGGGGLSLLCGALACRADAANRASNGGNVIGGATTDGGRSAACARRAKRDACVSRTSSAAKIVAGATTTGPPIAYWVLRPSRDDFTANLTCNAAAMNGAAGAATTAGGRMMLCGLRRRAGSVFAA